MVDALSYHLDEIVTQAETPATARANRRREFMRSGGEGRRSTLGSHYAPSSVHLVRLS